MWGFNQILNAVFTDKHEILELLLTLDHCGGDAILHTGQTLLHIVAANSDLRTIEILSHASDLLHIDVEMRDSNEHTALDYAMERGDAVEFEMPFRALLKRISGL